MSFVRDKLALMKFLPWTAGFLCLTSIFSSVALAQDNAASPSKSTISGTVINAVTKAPIPRALVSSPDSRYAKLSDGDGHFEFEIVGQSDVVSPPISGQGVIVPGVSGDSIWLTARKPGFLMEGENGANAIAGQDVTISLTPEAMIVGRVSFSTPETTSSVTVQLFARQVQDGLPRWTFHSSSQTNSAGEFRFANLHSGSYKLSTTESLDNDPAAMLPRSQNYGFPPVYYPNATDLSTAGTIELGAGQTVQADLSVTRQPYYQVRIPVNGDMGNGVSVTVSPQGHRGPGYSLGINGVEHRIEGLLPNGNYVVDAISYGDNAASGTTSLRVAGGPAEGQALTMVPNSGIVLNVKEEFSNQAETGGGFSNVGGSVLGSVGSRFQRLPVRGPRAYLQATLEPADDLGNMMQATLRPPRGPDDDSLVLTNVSPGQYWLRLYPGMRGYAASATMGAIDLLHQPLTVTTGSGGQIDITMRDDFASVEGTVSGTNNASPNNPQSNVWIYFVPLPDSAGEPTQTSIDPQGHFGPLEIVPGAYRVLTFPRVRYDLPYRDAQGMKPYETKGQVVHLSPGQKANLQLQVIPGE